MSYSINVNSTESLVNVAGGQSFYISPAPYSANCDTVANSISMNANGTPIIAQYQSVVSLSINAKANICTIVLSANAINQTINIPWNVITYTPVQPLTALWPDPLPNGNVNVAYSYTLTASGGVPPYTYTLASGTLPTGLSLNSSTGVISGTPTQNISMDAVSFTVSDTIP